MKEKFALIGASGYVAPRHMRAIKENNCNLLVAVDPCDSVGIIDSYFPEASFFTEIERFDRHVDKLRRRGGGLDYVSICSPNYLHDSHIRLALRNNCNVICEKPMVINPENASFLEILENESGKKINNILQLRLHEAIINLKKSIDYDKIYDIDLTYITPRGRWYEYSWKGEQGKSGGLPTNIGIHFFDVLTWIFGKVQKNVVFTRDKHTASGHLVLEKANVRWLLSVDKKNLPAATLSSGERTYRSLKIDNEEFEFSTGFENLHTKSYEEILNGNGFGVSDGLPSIELVHDICNCKVENNLKGEYHPLLGGIR